MFQRSRHLPVTIIFPYNLALVWLTCARNLFAQQMIEESFLRGYLATMQFWLPQTIYQRLFTDFRFYS